MLLTPLAFAVLERCNFVWTLNYERLFGRVERVLERCNFVWILNYCDKASIISVVLERCNFVWILNRPRCLRRAR